MVCLIILLCGTLVLIRFYGILLQQNSEEGIPPINAVTVLALRLRISSGYLVQSIFSRRFVNWGQKSKGNPSTEPCLVSSRYVCGCLGL